MITELPNKIQSLGVSQHVVDTSRDLLDQFRRRRVEGCLLWYGYVVDADICIVTTCVCPDQTNDAGSYTISTESMQTVRRHVRPYGLLLLMQVHSHPRGTRFSDWDACNALNKRPGALNMVVPDYGDVAWIDTNRFNVVELNERGEWRPWTAEEWRRLRVIPSTVNTYRNDGHR